MVQDIEHVILNENMNYNEDLNDGNPFDESGENDVENINQSEEPNDENSVNGNISQTNDENGVETSTGDGHVAQLNANNASNGDLRETHEQDNDLHENENDGIMASIMEQNELNILTNNFSTPVEGCLNNDHGNGTSKSNETNVQNRELKSENNMVFLNDPTTVIDITDDLYNVLRENIAYDGMSDPDNEIEEQFNRLVAAGIIFQ